MTVVCADYWQDLDKISVAITGNIRIVEVETWMPRF